MSSARARVLTVVLNANHSKKFTLVLQSSSTSVKDIILHEARNKFRMKGLHVVFLRGGAPLDDSALGDSDTIVWVGKGEPYSGPPAHPAQSNNRAEVRIIAEKSFIDSQAIKQLEAIASLPGVMLAVGLPDLHPGGRFPIGCAIASGEHQTDSVSVAIF
jgi:release factor H-coupled RctB family protein